METNGALGVDDIRAALAAVRHGRAAAGRRVVTPWWFHPLFGVSVASMFGAFSLRGAAVGIVIALSLLAQGALYLAYRRLTGLWVNTWKVDDMRRTTAVATVVALLVAYAGVALDVGLGLRGAAAASGVLLGGAYVVLWRWVDRRLAAQWTASP